MIACVGEAYDKKDFLKYIKANIELYFFSKWPKINN